MTTFLHVADVHLGACPAIGKTRSENQRKNELWNSFEAVVKTCEEKKIDLLLIAGDLFHRQPLRRELKEVDAMFSALTHTKVVLCAGNHDYLKHDSFYLTYQWCDQVCMVLSPNLSKIYYPELATEVYGFSYESKERTDRPYDRQIGEKEADLTRILLLHGGDEKHVPFTKEDLEKLPYDYIALGHIHKPGVLIPDKAIYPGALEPIDKNDVGPHGYIYGEIDEKGCHTEFVPFASREYVHLQVMIEKNMTGVEIKAKIREMIDQKGPEHIYKVTLLGNRNSEIILDLDNMDVYGNIIEFLDYTRLAYDMEKLKKQNKENVLGMLIDSFGNCQENSVEYEAMCKGVQALMETRR